ncbi:MAG: haloacid dehalogenase type II [Thermoleophilaceae bacterium]
MTSGPSALDRSAPAVVVLDVNETLADLTKLRSRFEAVGAPGSLLETWFAGTLRDGFAVTAAGGYVEFRTAAVATLTGLLSHIEVLAGEPRAAAEHIVDGFGELDLHPDVEPGLTRLRERGVRLVTLSNGSAELTRTLLERGGVADLVEQRLSADEAGRWKPALAPYAMAVRKCGVASARMALIAVHPWDVDGAARAGMRGAWLNRDGTPYPNFFTPPAVTAASLPALAGVLIGERA